MGLGIDLRVTIGHGSGSPTEPPVEPPTPGVGLGMVALGTAPLGS